MAATRLRCVKGHTRGKCFQGNCRWCLFVSACSRRSMFVSEYLSSEAHESSCVSLGVLSQLASLQQQICNVQQDERERTTTNGVRQGQV